MFKKKCRGCAEKVDKKFNYCPHCGSSLKAGSDDDMGMLGSSDMGSIQEDIKLPFGIEKIMGGLVKQLEKQLNNMDIDERTGMPKGVKIQIGKIPMNGNFSQGRPPKKMPLVISKEEMQRRAKLEKTNANSKVKRIGDVIIYEIDAPNISKKEDVVVTELETGIEIRAFGKDKCYVKVIPMKVDILGIKIDKEKVSVEVKG